jgi:hypothetical protein
MRKEKQIIGSEMDLSMGPKDMRSDAFEGGRVQFVGDMMNLPRRTTPMADYGVGTPQGKVEMLGSEVNLNSTPRRGWDSYETPISKNSGGADHMQSGYPTTKGKR